MHGEVTAFATPRRLALLVPACSLGQPDREVERRGPALQAAFDKHGNATKAADGFARSCGTTVDQLSKTKTDKGEWLSYQLSDRTFAIAGSEGVRIPIPFTSFTILR